MASHAACQGGLDKLPTFKDAAIFAEKVPVRSTLELHQDTALDCMGLSDLIGSVLM